MNQIIYIQFAACAFLTGLIWTVQLILYPALAYIDRARFVEFHNLHTQRITFIVGPMMLLELATAIMLLLTRREDLAISSVALLAIVFIWLSTALLSVPIHGKLARGYDLDQINRLVTTNWPRTILWTFRTVLLSYLVFAARTTQT